MDGMGLDRSTFRYWIDGDGAWMARWGCSGHDIVAAAFCIVSTVILFATYVLYARQNHQAVKLLQNSLFRSHVIELRNVFLLCGAIHVISSVLSWWKPLYYVTSISMLFNSWQCWTLTRSKKQILAIQQHTRGVAAEQHLEDVRQIVLAAHAEGMHGTLNKLQQVLDRAR